MPWRHAVAEWTQHSCFFASHLHLWRGELHVLRGVSFQLQSGQCLQVTGPNGAGKSTLLRALCGLLPLESGQVTWNGDDTQRDPLAFHAALAYLGHYTALKTELSAAENLRYSVGLRRPTTGEDIRAQLSAVGLPMDMEHRLVRQMSAGQQRRVALARVLLQRSPLWLLDEPNSNLDVAGQAVFSRMLTAHLQNGGMAVVATHHALSLSAGLLTTLELSA